ncbi:uncharacterized protein UTRI_03760 [Ustilago trichophora]|uniref:Uncharacterized protein n=1 Tax=Ustilago trichophora TaxID=86804 RepID=A0A5C3E4Y8_9BASI|nr:uncharacterized protein UTRI_03760 [Ustilago trichophora]
MAPNNKASVDKSTTIRAASKNKHRTQPKSATASPFGSSTGGSLASSLSSLFSPQPHGKDAALASLLASSSKPAVKLGQGSGLAAFGSFPSAQQAGKGLDEKLKERRKDAAAKASATDTTASATATNNVDAAPKASGSTSKDAQKPSQSQKQATKPPAPSSTSAPPKPAPNVPTVPAGRRPVFRPVLASSTAVTWPEMPVAGSKTVLHTLLETLAQPEIQEALNRDLGERSRKTKQANNNRSTTITGKNSQTALVGAQVLAGINSITRAIEGDIAIDLVKMHSNTASKDLKRKGKESVVVAPPSVEVVFVCRHDLPQPSLISHLPMLVCARNAVLYATTTTTTTDDAQGLLLIPLPSGSESLLAKALNLKRASILALTSAFPTSHMTHLKNAIRRETGQLCNLRASWLETAMRASASSSSSSSCPISLSMPLQPTSIKLLRTTQPVDFNLCKATKKLKRKQRSARWKKRKFILIQRVKSLRAELKWQRQKQKNEKNRNETNPNTKAQTIATIQMDTS